MIRFKHITCCIYLKSVKRNQFILVLIIQAMIDFSSTTNQQIQTLLGINSKMSKAIQRYTRLLTLPIGLVNISASTRTVNFLVPMKYSLECILYMSVLYSLKVLFITHSIMKRKIGSTEKIMESGPRNSFL